MTKSEAKAKALVEYFRDFRGIVKGKATGLVLKLEKGFQQALRDANSMPVLNEHGVKTGVMKAGGGYDNVMNSLKAYLDTIKEGMGFTKQHFICDDIEEKMTAFMHGQPAYQLLSPYMTMMTKFLDIKVLREYPKTVSRHGKKQRGNRVFFHLDFLPKNNRWEEDFKNLGQFAPGSYDFNLTFLYKTYGNSKELKQVVTDFRRDYLIPFQYQYKTASAVGEVDGHSKFLMLTQGRVVFDLTPADEKDVSKLVISKCVVYRK